MGKKKITPKVKNTEQLENNVVLKFMKKGKVLKTESTHNKATYNLLEGICRFLGHQIEVGTNSVLATNWVPNYLGIGNAANTNPDVSNIKLDSELPIGSRIRLEPQDVVKQNDGSYNITYTALLPYTTTKGYVIREMGLFTTPNINAAKLLARIILDNVIDYNLPQLVGVDLLVEWTISIGNK